MAVIVSGSSACHHYFVSAQAKGGGLSDLLQSSLERAVKKRAVANLFGEICPQYSDVSANIDYCAAGDCADVAIYQGGRTARRPQNTAAGH